MITLLQNPSSVSRRFLPDILLFFIIFAKNMNRTGPFYSLPCLKDRAMNVFAQGLFKKSELPFLYKNISNASKVLRNISSIPVLFYEYLLTLYFQQILEPFR